MAQNNALLDHEVALLPVQGQILLPASTENQTEMVKAFRKEYPKMKKSSMNTSKNLSIMSENILSIQH